MFIKTKVFHLFSFVLFSFAVAAYGQEVFFEDFEDPDLMETPEPLFTSERVPDAWVVGPLNPETGKLVYGAERQGIVDASNRSFVGSPRNEQAYAFRYTASPQIVSARSAFQVPLEEGAVYTLSFDVQQDMNDNESPTKAIGYDAYIIAFAPDANRGKDLNGKRQDFDDKDHHILERLTGTVRPGPLSTRVELSYTGVPADSEHFGKEVAIAFKDVWVDYDKSEPSSGVIDNVSFKVDRIPESSAFALLFGFFGVLLMRRNERRDSAV